LFGGHAMSDDADNPITLADACNHIFRGKIKPATLRAESASSTRLLARGLAEILQRIEPRPAQRGNRLGP
jgi:hypothetical protein